MYLLTLNTDVPKTKKASAELCQSSCKEKGKFKLDLEITK